MSSSIAAQVSEWLNTLPRTSSVPVSVTIGRSTFYGASYAQVREVSPGCRAYAEGEREYTMRALYLLGELPASYRHRHAGAYVGPDGTRFYVAGHYAQDPESALSANAYHPFGRMFMLCPDSAGVTADARTMPIATRELA
jgi:hypothetical protein